MRSHRVLHSVVAVAIAVATCVQVGCEPQCKPGCGDHERCIDKSCQHCGLPGEKCCQPHTDFVCDHGECNNAGTNVCPGGSQSPPECVPGSCPDGANCVDGQCEPPSDPCQGGTTPFTFDLIDGGCYKFTFTYLVNSQQEAEQCASDEVAKFDPNGVKQTQACPVIPGFFGNAALTDVCETFQGNNSPLQFWNCGGDQIAICEKNMCGADPDDCTWTEAKCAGQP